MTFVAIGALRVKTFILSIFEWPFFTDLTVVCSTRDLHLILKKSMFENQVRNFPQLLIHPSRHMMSKKHQSDVMMLPRY